MSSADTSSSGDDVVTATVTSVLNASADSLHHDDHHGHQHAGHESCGCCWTTTIACVLAIYVILFKYKSPLQYYVKFVTYVAITMIFALFIIPFVALRPNSPKNINSVALCLRNLFRIFGLKFTVEDGKYLQINQPYILVCNHQSSLDFITMMNVWPGGNCTPLAKKELIYSGPFGIAIWLCGITFIDRLNHEKAKGTIDALADRINRENLQIWIYPEGTRSLKTELLPFKKGAFHLAVQAQIPIVCVVTSSYLNFYSKKEKKWITDGEVKVKVLPPFQTKGMTSESVGQLTKHLHESMQKTFDQLNEEIKLEKKYLPNKVVEAEDNLDTSFNSSLIKENLGEKETNTSSPQILNDDNNNSITEEDNKKIN